MQLSPIFFSKYLRKIQIYTLYFVMHFSNYLKFNYCNVLPRLFVETYFSFLRMSLNCNINSKLDRKYSFLSTIAEILSLCHVEFLLLVISKSLFLLFLLLYRIKCISYTKDLTMSLLNLFLPRVMHIIF